MAKKRLAILGAGVGSMSATWAITSRPNWQDDYEITVYTLGWRIGGKGASGRNPDHGDRIEEHGLHIWMGFYNNAFKMMQDCYAELARTPGCPIREWTDAFRPHSYSVLYEFVEGHWRQWPIEMPINSGVPGSPGDLPSPVDYLEMLIEWMLESIIGPTHEAALQALFERAAGDVEKIVPSFLGRVERYCEERLRHLIDIDAARRRAFAAWLVADLHEAVELAQAGAAHANGSRITENLLAFLDRLRVAATPVMAGHDATRRLWLLMDLGVAIIKGMIADDVLHKGFEAIEDYEFRAWIAGHGASRETLASAPVRSLYDLCFAYVDGNLDKPNMAAGTFVRTALLMAFAYKGAFMYRMTAGMGDIVFTPLYEVLRKRGVKFEFFQRVTALTPSADGTAIDEIHINRQVRLKAGVTAYDPLVDVKGLPCWPSAPRFEQIENGEALKASGENIENYWCPWPSEPRVLSRGRDFDEIVLGISVGALGEIGAALKEHDPRWKAMCENVATVETMGVQIWLRKTLAELGWQLPPAVAGTFAEPLDTWADMSDLLERENWPADHMPQAIVYLCGPMRQMPIPPDAGPPWVQSRHLQVIHTTRTWLQSHGATCWPHAASAHNPSGLDFEYLHDHTREDSLAAQYLRANIDPAERYVLSVAGSSKHRLRSGDSGFSNMVLAGDWVWTPINAGCVEAAAMGGLAAAQALCGWPQHISGWNESGPKPGSPRS